MKNILLIVTLLALSYTTINTQQDYDKLYNRLNLEEGEAQKLNLEDVISLAENIS